MHEWGQGKLHSGSKKGPEVKSKKQALAIGYSEARKSSHEKALSSRVEGVKKYGQAIRKKHEELTKKGETTLDHSQMRSYEKHLVKKGVQNKRFGQKEH